jgi:hypothetical protein
MQNEKEAEQRESLLRGSSQGYQQNGGMVYPQGNWLEVTEGNWSGNWSEL